MPDTGEDKDYKVSSEHSRLGKLFLRKSVIQTPEFSMTMDNLLRTLVTK